MGGSGVGAIRVAAVLAGPDSVALVPVACRAGPWEQRGRCWQRLCWGGTAIDMAEEPGDRWHADVYPPGSQDEPIAEVWAASQAECEEKADRVATAIGWVLGW